MTPSPSASDRALATLLALHGLAMLVVFPLGPQEARLWQPGIGGVSALAAAFPLACVLGGIIARRLPRLPSSTRTLAALALFSTLPCLLSYDYESFFAARVIAGFFAGISYIAIHRILPTTATAHVARHAPRFIAFGLPFCILAATALDWRAAFAPLLVIQAWLALRAPKQVPFRPSNTASDRAEPAPAALVATGALAAVSGSYLTVLSGYLVLNAGHTEWHIQAAILLGAFLGLAIPPAVARLRALLGDGPAFATTLLGSTLGLTCLLLLREPAPSALALTLIGAFLALNAARHLGLAGLILPRLDPADISVHQAHTHLAHHLGSGLGALSAGVLIHVSPGGGILVGMPALLAFALASTTLAGASAWAAVARQAIQPTATPAATPASANSR